jgi:hypothetical protein
MRVMTSLGISLENDLDEIINIYADAGKVRSDPEEQLAEWQHQIMWEE